MKKETIVKLLIAIIAVICIAWLGQIISNMILVALAMTASVFGLIVALLLRYGIPIAIIAFVLNYLFRKNKQNHNVRQKPAARNKPGQNFVLQLHARPPTIQQPPQEIPNHFLICTDQFISGRFFSEELGQIIKIIFHIEKAPQRQATAITGLGALNLSPARGNAGNYFTPDERSTTSRHATQSYRIVESS